MKPLVCVNENDKTLGDFLKKFSILSKLFISTDAIKEISMNCVLDAQKENIKAMELRFNPFSMARAGNLDPHQVMDAIIEGVREGEKETGMTVGLTTIIPRNKGAETGARMEALTQEYVKKGQVSYEHEAVEGTAGPGHFGNVTAIDLANDEANFRPTPTRLSSWNLRMTAFIALSMPVRPAGRKRENCHRGLPCRAYRPWHKGL